MKPPALTTVKEMSRLTCVKLTTLNTPRRLKFRQFSNKRYGKENLLSFTGVVTVTKSVLDTKLTANRLSYFMR